MRRARVAAAALAGALLAAAMVAGLAAAGAADRIGATFTLMADEFIQAFQPVEGIVVSLDGGLQGRPTRQGDVRRRQARGYAVLLRFRHALLPH